MATRTTTDYSALAKKIQRPSQKAARLPRILVYSRNKKGKSRFCTTAGQDNILIFDPEDGTDQFVQSDPHVWPVNRWEDLDEGYKFLKYGKHDYKWVGLDGMTRFSNMALRWIMHQAEEHDLNRRPGMVQQKDYGKAGEIMKAMMYNLHNLNMGVVYTAQERQVEGSFGDDDEDAEDATVQYVADLPKGVRSSVNSLVDVIGRLYTVKVERKDGTPALQRRLWLEPNIMYDTGYRSEFELPAYLRNPTIPRLVKLLKEGTTR